MYVEDCIEGTKLLMDSDVSVPLNSINELTDLVAELADIEVSRKHDLSAPQGFRGRNSDNTLIREQLGWEPTISLRDGMSKTFAWIDQQVRSLTIEP